MTRLFLRGFETGHNCFQEGYQRQPEVSEANVIRPSKRFIGDSALHSAIGRLADLFVHMPRNAGNRLL
ncbi:hypothetical protein A5662_23580 [Mycobacteriaceae bacterium 1482268.1]|nr:hypothetical protein A5662_23580 [Mycobacteriaceae bacterium 1482268.1]